MHKAFLFPGLRQVGYDSGFSIPLKKELERNPDLYAEILLFSNGLLAARHEITLDKFNSIFYRGWSVDWFPSPPPVANNDLYCLSLKSQSKPNQILPETEIEGQMLFRHREGWVSSILTGFVPIRPSGYRFAPIIHTAHYIASEQDVETITLFMNLKDVGEQGPLEAGILNAEVSTRAGKYLATIQYPVKGNSTVSISSDDINKKLSLPEETVRQGINVKFWGGESQFSILTVYRNRKNDSIGVEHSLAPFYYLPELVNSNVRALVYQQLGERS